MKQTLPVRFQEKMQQLLGSEFETFHASYDLPRVYGLRINPLKLSRKDWLAYNLLNREVELIPWTLDGLYSEEDERPGKHPHYHAGLYYIQEPSAMLPVELLQIEPGLRVLDLCAAPGGKSTQIAGKLNGHGILISNDNAANRTKVLAKNIELAGIRNAIVLNEEPSALVSRFNGWFDRILVDAPCSGEGMFRKEEAMMAEWEKHSVETCSDMQQAILSDAAAMLAPGGLLLYSTCTFSPEENEEQILHFLIEHPEFEIEPIRHIHGIAPGRADWVVPIETNESHDATKLRLSDTARVWPHKVAGEGHYVALLRRKDLASCEIQERTEQSNAPNIVEAKSMNIRTGSRKKQDSGHGRRPLLSNNNQQLPIEIWEQFMKLQLRFSREDLVYEPVFYGDKLYLQPPGIPSLAGLRVIRAGWYVGEVRKGRFSPSQALAMGLRKEQAIRTVDFLSSDNDVHRYLCGETLFVQEQQLEVYNDHSTRGLVLVCVDGFPIGWGKHADGMLKNELSSGWRRI